MAIEKFGYKIHTEEEKTKEILHAENIEEHLCALSEELFNQDLEVGFGNFARVYRDQEAGLVYKKIKPGTFPKNNVHEEARFLAELTQESKDVIVPVPIVSFVALLKREKDGRKVQQSVLAMQEIDGFSLDRMLPKNPGEKPEIEFPDNFDVDSFFQKLREFVEWMHNEKNIYHRDLFARNIMIEMKTGKPAIIDFGDAVEFDQKYLVPGEQDAYGRLVLDDARDNLLVHEDEDFKNLESLEQEIRGYLTKNINNVY